MTTVIFESKEKCLAVDLRNASLSPESNFSCKLFLLIMKADSSNRANLRKGFPVEVRMVEIMRSPDCPRGEPDAFGGTDPDWNEIERMARADVFYQQEVLDKRGE